MKAFFIILSLKNNKGASTFPGCSSANTLRIQRLEFGREQLTKGPDVIRHACRHRRCLLPPSGTNRPMACLLWLRQRLLQAHVGSGHIVEGLEKDHALPQPLAVFTKARRLPRQGGQGLPQGQVDPFNQSRADAQTQTGQAFGANHDARAECQQLALLLLFDQLPVDQIGMGLTAWLAGPPSLPSARKRRHDMEGSDQGRQRAREAVVKNAGMPATRAFVTATTSLAVSSVRGPTMAVIIKRNSGAKLTQTHCRPSALSGRLSPAMSVS